MAAYGLAEVLEKERENELLNAIYSLGSAMVNADGYIDPDEIAIAEGIGLDLIEDFDSVEFREYCNNPKQLSEAVELSETLREVFEDEHKELIIKYLSAISEADGSVSSEEKELLNQIAHGLGMTDKTV